ncbi:MULTISPECIES: YncE family protein [unclassified Bradyrhizobium]|uniref:lactonase family protein n=1 Tax=unclassified Bradyrhizobium TaxID=2631580 RepID=UPI00247AFDAC|nr:MULTISPECIES: YncE family protein [unclassified Bradyrhizobium]WGR70060.1 YncE family protein [Bradyrhizobium sp. ISRA426]WGR82117.1 YncE family protein [Bradyrhizobium sp. ISRA430]WGR85303.1 YncE family protein [Bradyrhizobium sp. ISRA432]
MSASRTVSLSFATAILLSTSLLGSAHAKPLMIVGLDEKLLWDDNGKPILAAPGKDQVLIVDLASPESPKIVASLPLKNSVVGPPVNVAINPTGTVALVADSVDVVKDGDALKQVLDNKIYVIDLQANPPKLTATLTGGKQPSGLSFSPDGKMALVANRGDNSISVLSVSGSDVKIIDSVAMPDSVSHVTFTPDGKRALVARFPAHKISLLDVGGDKVTYSKIDLPTGLWPYNVAVAPGGNIALTSDNGNAGASDGSVDTASVIDLEANPPRIIDRVVVGDGPEGLAISPKGDVAVSVILRGSNTKNAYFYEKNGSISVLKIDGKKVTKTQDIEVGGLPEAAVFTPDGRYLLVGNYLTQDFSILKVDGANVTDTGKRFQVPGHPASARMGP